MFNRKEVLIKYGFKSNKELIEKTGIPKNTLNDFIAERTFNIRQKEALKLDKIIPLYEFYIKRA